MSTEKINLAVRIRPRLASEEVRKEIINIQNENMIRISDGEKYLEVIFDNIFNFTSTNQDIYSFIQHGVQQTLKGENCSVMAYGPTSSGKSYTIFGSKDLEDGLVTYSLQEMYAAIETQGKDQFRLEINFYCIENERIFDLFQDFQPKMTVVNDPVEGLIVECSRSVMVDSKEQAFEIIKKGLAKAEELNKQELSLDFSHKILMFKLHTNFPDAQGFYIRGKCVFCDLAGSERKRRNGLTSVSPSIHILTSLLMGREKEPLISQDSRVSQVIRDCIPPNSRTYFIATVAPIIDTASECLKTLNILQGVQKKITHIKQFKFHYKNIEWIAKYREAIDGITKQLELAGVTKEELGPVTPPDFLEPYISKYISLKYELEALRQSSYDPSSTVISDEPNNQDLTILLGKRGAELQNALEQLRKKEIEVAASELKNKLPGQGRCPVCTLKIPCKHYEKLIEIPPVPARRGRTLSPWLNISVDSRKPDISLLVPKHISPATSGGRSFKIRYRGAGISLEKSLSPICNQNLIWQDSKRLKMIEKLEAYKEEKIRREIDQIEAIKRKEMQDTIKERQAEEKRRKYIEKQKQKLTEYHQDQEKKKDMERDRMDQLEKLKKEKNVSRNVKV